MDCLLGSQCVLDHYHQKFRVWNTTNRSSSCGYRDDDDPPDGSSTKDTTVQVPFGVVATGANLLIGALISFFPSGKRFYLIAAIAVIPLIGEVVQFTVSAQGPALMGYYFTGAFNAPYVMMLGVVSSNTAGATKKWVPTES